MMMAAAIKFSTFLCITESQIYAGKLIVTQPRISNDLVHQLSAASLSHDYDCYSDNYTIY
jgi:hypothetical protein